MTLFEEPALAPDQPTGLGAAMCGGNPKTPRRGNDYYPTPADVTRALLRKEAQCIAMTGGGRVWEPCGRGGAIIRELAALDLDVVGTDLVADPANGVTAQDVLQVKRAPARAAVTNPPFAIAAEIIVHLLDRLKLDYLALLLKGSYWHAEKRTALFRAHRPSRIYALNWRPDFLALGAPVMEVQWCIWQRGWPLATHYDVLTEEADRQGDLL